MIDLHNVKIGSTMWYKGIECVVIMLRKSIDDTKKVVWTISLVDKENYLSDYGAMGKLFCTGEIYWNHVSEFCRLSNAIDFIRGDL